MDRGRLCKLGFQAARPVRSLTVAASLPSYTFNDFYLPSYRMPNPLRLYRMFERSISNWEPEKLKARLAVEVDGPTIDPFLFEDPLIVPSSSNYQEPNINALIRSLIDKDDFDDAYEILETSQPYSVECDWAFLKAAKTECSHNTSRAISWLTMVPSDYSSWRRQAPSRLMRSQAPRSQWTVKFQKLSKRSRLLNYIICTLTSRHAMDYDILYNLTILSATKGWFGGIRYTLRQLTLCANPAFAIRCFYECSRIARSATERITIDDVEKEIAVWARTILITYWHHGRKSLAIHLLSRLSKSVDIGRKTHEFYLAHATSQKLDDLVERIKKLMMNLQPSTSSRHRTEDVDVSSVKYLRDIDLPNYLPRFPEQTTLEPYPPHLKQAVSDLSDMMRQGGRVSHKDITKLLETAEKVGTPLQSLWYDDFYQLNRDQALRFTKIWASGVAYFYLKHRRRQELEAFYDVRFKKFGISIDDIGRPQSLSKRYQIEPENITLAYFVCGRIRGLPPDLIRKHYAKFLLAYLPSTRYPKRSRYNPPVVVIVQFVRQFCRSHQGFLDALKLLVDLKRRGAFTVIPRRVLSEILERLAKLPREESQYWINKVLDRMEGQRSVAVTNSLDPFHMHKQKLLGSEEEIIREIFDIDLTLNDAIEELLTDVPSPSPRTYAYLIKLLSDMGKLEQLVEVVSRLEEGYSKVSIDDRTKVLQEAILKLQSMSDGATVKLDRLYSQPQNRSFLVP